MTQASFATHDVFNQSPPFEDIDLTAALNQVSPHQAELFATTRLATNHASMYGAVDLGLTDVRALLERALP